ncbi:energy-coupling factor transporter ATPase [Staphylococcus canis]|uniref:Energy-coupling factor transporter ATPase n=1 Tax=Staphylococcus canis TaxID=2724942 RepID=A0ABS0T9N4_9STAP|nr:energy-coupling factor transporter ATPase [Staphylococcus canis]MBI5974676.1 energy-coupling factor transporter ATPase [Staphylococcus canis]
MSDIPLLQFKDVTFQYDSDGPAILKNVSYDVYPGQWVSIVGHNGSGKSTMAKLIAGIEQTFDGDILIDQSSIKGTELSAFHHHIGIVFQNPDNQFVGSTVNYDVAFGLENKSVPTEEMHEIVARVLKDVDMYDKQNHEPSALSGGQKQRVAIAGVLALQPKLIILDEATAMLDPEGKREIFDMIKKLNHVHQVTVISITHDLSEVVESDKIIVMNQGRIAMSGSVASIFKHSHELLEMGLDLPFEMRIAQKLNLSQAYLNYDELLESLT